MTQQLLLTETEAAERLRVSMRTLRKARQEGVLQYVLIGRAIRYTLGDLESYIERLRQVQPACPPSRPISRNSQPARRRNGEIVPFMVRNRTR